MTGGVEIAAEPEPPHPAEVKRAVERTKRIERARQLRSARRRVGRRIRTRVARVAPPMAEERNPGGCSGVRAACEAVVEMVKVAVPVPPEARVMLVGEARQVGMAEDAPPLNATEQLTLTGPLKPAVEV